MKSVFNIRIRCIHNPDNKHNMTTAQAKAYIKEQLHDTFIIDFVGTGLPQENGIEDMEIADCDC